MEKQELQGLIDRLQRYSEQEYNNNCIAEDLKVVAALLQQMVDCPKKIAVATPLGRLEACIGGDPECPEIFTYIVRPDGVEIDLVACEVKVEEDMAQAYLYGDTQTEAWTRSYQWTKDAINID